MWCKVEVNKIPSQISDALLQTESPTAPCGVCRKQPQNQIKKFRENVEILKYAHFSLPSIDCQIDGLF